MHRVRCEPLGAAVRVGAHSQQPRDEGRRALELVKGCGGRRYCRLGFERTRRSLRRTQPCPVEYAIDARELPSTRERLHSHFLQLLGVRKQFIAGYRRSPTSRDHKIGGRGVVTGHRCPQSLEFGRHSRAL